MKTYVVGTLLEALHQGASNKYPQLMFSWKIRKNINTFGLRKRHQELCILAKAKSLHFLSFIEHI